MTSLRALMAMLRPDLAPIRHSRDFRLLYLGQAGSFAGSMICYVAMPYQAYQLSHSSLIVGLLSSAELAPVLLAGMLGGAAADAMERRRIILLTEAVAFAGVCGLIANALLWHRLPVLFALAAVLAGAFGLQRPSIEVMVPALVPHDDLTAAAALAGLLGTVAQTAGPLAAGALLSGGLPLAYAVAGAMCAAAALPFALLDPSPPPAQARRPSIRDMAEGLRYARGRPDLLGSYLIDVGAMLFGVPFAVFPQLAARLGGPAVLGLLFAAPGFGSLAVSLTSAWTRRVRRHGRAITLAVCAWSLAIAAFGFAPDLPLAVVALAAAGGADMVSGLFRMTMWNQSIPARVRGRLAGLEMISYSVGEPLGNAETGAIAALTGSVRLAVVSGGLASLAGAVVVSLALPGLWRYDARDMPISGPGQIQSQPPFAAIPAQDPCQ